MTKSLEELQALKNRLVQDVSRSRMQDQYGLDNNSPLIRNLRQVEADIANWKAPEETVSESTKIEEKKIVVGSLDHMTHALHAHHTGMGYAAHGIQDPDYHFHHMGFTHHDDPKKPSDTKYLVVGRNNKEAHHFTVGYSPQKQSGDKLQIGPGYTYDVKHVAKVM